DALAANEVEGRLYDEMAPDEVMVSFGGHLHSAQSLPMVFERDVRLQNYYIPGGAPTVTYDFTADSDDVVNEPGMDVDLKGMSSHTMSEGDAITFTLRITVNSVVPNDYYDGDVVASSSSGQILRLPFMIYMGQGELHVDPLLTNTESYFFALFPLKPTSVVDMFVKEPDDTIVDVNLNDWSKVSLE
ncbi:MAG: hypothetical protein KAW09_03805, partial [Thermoplasmata archaeon]|nr:hypothetical protein [Thermoplasmata archaeon]